MDRKRLRRSVAVCIPLLLMLGINSCGDADTGAGPADTSTTGERGTSDHAMSTTGQPDADWTQVELAVLDAISDDPHPKQARYEADGGRVVVTVHLLGEGIPVEDLRDVEARAEDATDVVDVVVTTADEDVPTED